MTVGTSSVVVLPARLAGNRRGFAIENDGTTPIVIGYGSAVTASARSFRIEAKGSNDATDYFEDPFMYQGAISALSVGAAGGAINITELVII